MQAGKPDETLDCCSARPPTPPGFREEYGTRSPSQCLVRRPRGRRHVEVSPIDSVGDVVVLEITRMPTSFEEHLASQFTYALRRIKLDERWPAFVPPRLGSSVTVDLAAKALVKAQDFAATRYTGSVNSSLRPYTEALSHLRADIAVPGSYLVDDTAVAVALLSLVERMLRPATAPGNQHMTALYTILSFRGPQPKASKSNIIAALYYDSWTITFLRPVLLGVASPFDDPLCHDLDPVGLTDLPTAIKTIRAYSHQLLLRLPTLIVLVREVRTAASADAAKEATSLAIQLLRAQDSAMEAELLQGVRVTETIEARDREVTQTSYEFDSIAQFDAAMAFWSARLMLCRLCRTLNTIAPPHDALEISPETVAAMLMHVFKSWQYGVTSSATGMSAVALEMLALCGSLLDYPDLFEPDLSAVELQHWGLANMNLFLTRRLALDWREMRLVADLFVGGPVTGRAAETARGLFNA